MKVTTPEWHKNNGSALQALICGKDPDDFIRKGNIEPCSITQAAEICKVTTYVIRRYTFGRFPEIYQRLGIEAMPPLDAYTQTFEMTEVKKWARHLEKIRAKAEAIAPQKPKMTQAEAEKRGWVTMGDLARVSRIKSAKLSSWFRTGLPAKYGTAEEFPTPTYKSDNVCYYDGSALEWAKRLGSQVAAVQSKEEDELRKKASIVPKPDPLHIRRTAVAKMLNITSPTFALWQLHGIPKKLKVLGCPELPKPAFSRQRADYYRAEDVAPWVLAYKKAVQALKEKRK